MPLKGISFLLFFLLLLTAIVAEGDNTVPLAVADFNFDMKEEWGMFVLLSSHTPKYQIWYYPGGGVKEGFVKSQIFDSFPDRKEISAFFRDAGAKNFLLALENSDFGQPDPAPMQRDFGVMQTILILILGLVLWILIRTFKK